MMARPALSEILDQWVEDVRAGRATLKDCLERYPELGPQLEPLLRIALSIVPPAGGPDPPRKLAARARFIEALYEQPAPSGLRGALTGLLAPARPLRLGAPGLASLVLALALATGGGVAYASEQSQPGEPLYGVKLALEQVRVAAALDEEARIEAHTEIAARRLAEVKQAVATRNDRAAEAAAEGYVRALAQAEARSQGLADPEVQERVLERLEAKLGHQQRILAHVAQQAPPPARESVERAREHAHRGFEQAAASVAGERDEAHPAGPSSAPTGAAVAPQDARRTRERDRPAATSTPRPTAEPQLLGQLEALTDQTDRVEVQLSAGLDQSLTAKLDAARAALRRGRIEAAANQLRAFRNELKAAHRSGRLGDDAYRRLLAASDTLIRAIEEAKERAGRPRGTEDRPPDNDGRRGEDRQRGPDAHDDDSRVSQQSPATSTPAPTRTRTPTRTPTATPTAAERR